MAITRSNPLAFTNVGTIDPRPFTDEIQRIVRRINDADDANRGWLEKQAKLTKLRYGHRLPRNIPWKGCSNITIPIIDKTIRRWRPPMASLILDAEPIAIFTPQEASDFDPARTVEPFFTWMFREQMKTRREVVLLLDNIAHRGHGYSREGWHYRTSRQSRVVPLASIFPEGLQVATEQAAATAGQPVSPLELAMQRIATMYAVPVDNPQGRAAVFQTATRLLQGADFSQLILQDLYDDRPDWRAIDPINVITTVDQNPQHSDFFVMVYHKGEQDIVAMARDGVFRTDAAGALLEHVRKGNVESPHNTPADDVRETLRRIRDRGANIESETRKNSMAGNTVIWEIFTMLDVNRDGVDERVVIWYAPSTKTILQLFEFPYPFDAWPITPYEFNVDSERMIDNRGITEMVAAFQKIASAMYNARLDASDILLAPAFKQRVTGGNYKKSVNWRPGALIPVTHPDDVTPILHDLRILVALLQEQQVGQAIAEDYIGTFDATIGRLQDQSGPERRTATEVSAIQNVAASVFGLDAKLFVEALSDSFTKIWNLYEEWGPEETFFRVQGEPKPTLAKKSEISRNYDIRAAGTPANTQKQIMLANYREALGLALQDKSGLLNTPLILQSFLKLVDPIVAKQAIRPPEETRQVQAIQAAAEIVEPGGDFGAI